MKNSYLKKFMVVTLTAIMAVGENPAILAAEDFADEAALTSSDEIESENAEVSDEPSLPIDDSTADFASEEEFSEDELLLENEEVSFSGSDTAEEMEEFSFVDGEEKEEVTAVQSSGTLQFSGKSMKADLQEGENTFLFTPSAEGFYEFEIIINDKSLEDYIGTIELAELGMAIDGLELDTAWNLEKGKSEYVRYYLKKDKTYTVTSRCKHYWTPNDDDYDDDYDDSYDDDYDDDDYDGDDYDDYDDDNYDDDDYDNDYDDDNSNGSVGKGTEGTSDTQLSLTVNFKCTKTYPSNIVWAKQWYSSNAENKQEDFNLFYSLDSAGTLTIEKGNKENGECYVRYEGVRFTERDTIKKIVIGEGITDFNKCTEEMPNLTEIQLPYSLKRFGVNNRCFKLKKIIIPENNSLISVSSMRDTSYVKNNSNAYVMLGNVLVCYKGKEKDWKISKSVKAIGDTAALDNTDVKKITVPGTVTDIGYAAFAGDTALESVVLEDGVKKIGPQAFFTTSSLKEITIPKSVTQIDVSAIGYRATNPGGNLSGVCKAENLPTINCYPGSIALDYAQKNNIPYKLIEEKPISLVGKTFTSGNYKYKITAKNTVTFTGLKKQKTSTVKIGNTVKYKGKTYNITAIANKALYNNKYVTQITVGNKVKTIGASSFANCKKLKSVTFGTVVTTIGGSAMKNDSKLTSVVIKSTKLKTVKSNAFKGISKKAKIKVPSSKLKSYKKLLKNKGQSSKVKIVK